MQRRLLLETETVEVLDLDLATPTVSLAPDHAAWVLAWFAGAPVGTVLVPPRDAGWSPTELRRQLVDACAPQLLHNSLVRSLLDPDRHGRPVVDLLGQSTSGPGPHDSGQRRVTVAVCTRDHPMQLSQCLRALDSTLPGQVELLVVDNAPAAAHAASVVHRHPRARYILEPTPGLDHARNTALRTASTDIVAFIDDDVIVDARWLEPMLAAFEAEPEVAAVCGLVAPFELTHVSQRLFEARGGFARGVERRWSRSLRGPRGGAVTSTVGPMGRLGTGANLAVDRVAALRVGGFDPALDVGTPTNGGGDLDMLYRILRGGYTVAYEPGAVVWHRHRTSVDELARQLDGHGAGQVAHLMAAARLDPGDLGHLASHAARQVLRLTKRMGGSALGRGLPLTLTAAEARGFVSGPFRYRSSRRANGRRHVTGSRRLRRPHPESLDGVVDIQMVDITRPVEALPESGAAVTVVHLLDQARYLTSFSLHTGGAGVGRLRLAETLAAALVNSGELTIDLTAPSAATVSFSPEPAMAHGVPEAVSVSDS